MAEDQKVNIPKPDPGTNTMSQTGTMSGVAFNLFPSLPTELRLQIWRHALEQPRAITISSKLLEDRLNAGLPSYPCWRCPVTGQRYEQVSALFFVNHEARFVALNYNQYNFFSVAMRDPQATMSSLYPLRFATTPNDFVVADTSDISWADPNHELVITRSEGFGKSATSDLAIPRLLVVRGPNEPKIMRVNRFVSHKVWKRVLGRTRKVFGPSPAAAFFKSLHFLEPSWVVTPQGLSCLIGLPDVNISIWNSQPLLEHIMPDYNQGPRDFHMPSPIRNRRRPNIGPTRPGRGVGSHV